MSCKNLLLGLHWPATFSEIEVDLQCCHELWLMATDIAGQLRQLDSGIKGDL